LLRQIPVPGFLMIAANLPGMESAIINGGKLVDVDLPPFF
jgi:hypothetical protein